MKKILGILLGISLLIVTTPAFAGKNSCTVSPNPVPEGSDYTVTASKLRPLTNYWIKITDQSEHYGHHPVTFNMTDNLGNFSITLNTNMPPRDSVFAGDSPSIRIYPVEGGGTGSNCKFSVIN